MAFSLNRAQIIGNVTKAPEVRSAGGQKVATFGVATNFVWKDATGVKKERAEFHNVVAWRRLAEICELYLKKGTKVYIEGRIQTRDWEGEDGVKRYKTEIIADNMIMLDKKGSLDSGFTPMPAEDREQRPVKSAKLEEKSVDSTPQQVEEEVSIDDLPF